MSGIVRKIDELGRIVIPKEIRKVLGIKQGSDISIKTDGDAIVLNKFCPITTIENYVDTIANTLFDYTGYSVIVTNQEKIIACVGLSKNEFFNKPLKESLLNEVKCMYNNDVYDIIDNQTTKILAMCVVPIMVQGRILGSIILVDKTNHNKQISDTTKDIAKCMAHYISSLLY